MLEPLYEFVVVITIKGDDMNDISSKLPVLTLAHTKYHAREKVHTKMMHMYPDINSYSFGTKALVYKPDPVALN